MEECFNCVTPAAGRYTLVLAESTVVEDAVLCRVCAPDFRDLDWVEVEQLSAPAGGERLGGGPRVE